MNGRIVVSHHSSLDFLDLSGDLWVYNKSGKPVSGVTDIQISNDGREGSVYLRHIIENYDNLADKTIFIQDDLHNHQPSIDKFIEHAEKDIDFYQFPCTWRKDNPTLHKREIVNGFIDLPTIRNKEAIVDFCWRFNLTLPYRYETETCCFFMASRDVLRSVTKEKYKLIASWLRENPDNEFVFEHCYKLLFIK
jgi:hypothetical protein